MGCYEKFSDLGSNLFKTLLQVNILHLQKNLVKTYRWVSEELILSCHIAVWKSVLSIVLTYTFYN